RPRRHPPRPQGPRRRLRRAAAARPRRGAVGVPLAAARPLRGREPRRVVAARRREGVDVRGQGGGAMRLTILTNTLPIDCTGADYGFREAIEEGLYPGPRLLVSGNYISQTGGHGDKRRRAEWIPPIDCCIGMIGSIADGEAEVRKAAREQIRRDVNQIKLMASGGAMSPSDELDTTQFTVAEMRAAVEEAQAVGKYVLAHAYSDSAVRNAIAAGVRSIEHGNLIREAAAKAIKDAGAFLVPTMVTYEAIYREGKRYGIGDHQIQKINLAREQPVQGLTYAYRAGCEIGSGCDRLGDMMAQP